MLIDSPDQTQILDPARFTPVETAIYRLSPLGFRGTTLAILVVAFGCFALVAELTGRPHLGYLDGAGGWTWNSVSWIGFVLSLVLTAAIALAELEGRRWAVEQTSLRAAVDETGQDDAAAICKGAPRSWLGIYRIASGAGLITGILFNVYILMGEGISLLEYAQSIGLWFLFFLPWLFMFGFRAGISVARRRRELRQLILQHVSIDLYHLDRLDVFGRVGLRAATSWLVMAGVLLLFVADRSQLWIAIPCIGLAVLGGLVALTGALRPIQAKILAAKGAELDEVHRQMARARERAFAGDDAAASALAGLTDYEVWIERRPEWPISTSVTLRFGLYILIPVLPILGSYLFEKFADRIVYGGVF